MPKVKVEAKSKNNSRETFDRICKMLETDQDLRKLDPGIKCNFDSNSLTGSAKGNQFKADMSVKENAGGAMVEIVVDLPFHLALVKGLVEKTLQKKLEKTLA